MAFKFLAFCALVAVARAGVVSHAPAYAAAPAYVAGPAYHAGPALAHAPVLAHAHHAHAEHDDYDPNPQYSFAYDVQDGLTGDSKSQHETRSGDVVQGSYSLIDADGHKRTVDYTADPHNGFNAVVHREPLVHKTVVAAAPVAVHAAPAHYAAAPAHYAAAPAHYAAAPAHYGHSEVYHH